MKIEIYRDTNRQRRFRVRGNNGLIIAQGEGYHNLQDCLHTVALLIGMSDDNTRIEITDGRVAEINSAIGERAVAQGAGNEWTATEAGLLDALSEANAKVAALQAFKDYVHNTLTAMNVPVDPPGEHSAAGCRVGQRLQCLHDQLRTLFAETRELRGQLTDAQQQNNTLRELEAAHPSQTRAPLQPGFGRAEVIVDRQGIRFGEHGLWMSHERITGREAADINAGLSIFVKQYAQFVSTAIDGSAIGSSLFEHHVENVEEVEPVMPRAPNSGVEPMAHVVTGHASMPLSEQHLAPHARVVEHMQEHGGIKAPTPHMSLDEARAALAADDRKPSPDDE